MDTKLLEQPLPSNNVPRNQFDFGNINLVTIRAGELVPVFAKKLMPNDRINFNTEVYGRLMPLINPIYSKYKFYIYNFFVPTRITFPQFERFRANKKVSQLNGASYSPIPPRCSLWYVALGSCYSYLETALRNSPYYTAYDSLNEVGIWTNSLPDYLNMPCTNEISFNFSPNHYEPAAPLNTMPLTSVDLCAPAPTVSNPNPTFSKYSMNYSSVDTSASCFSYLYWKTGDTEDKSQGNRLVFIEKFIAYTLIWYDYFRDWRLDDYTFSPYDFIHECTTEHQGNYDYYFSADRVEFFMDHPQLNWFALRQRTFTSDMFVSAFPTPQLGDAMQIPQYTDFSLETSIYLNTAENLRDIHGMVTGVNPTPKVFNFLNGTPPTIDELHKAEQMQKYVQMLMVHGFKTRDLDKLFYGVTSTLPFDQPVFVHGDTLEFEFNEVLQTSESTSNHPLGDFAGRGSVFGGSNSKEFTADEFGYFFTIVCAVPKQAYYQGMPREFTRNWDYFDLPNEVFANLGFDNIDNEEVMFNYCPYQSNPADFYTLNKTDFGYITRYMDYRICPDEIHGSFRSSLRNWHSSRFFVNSPKLNTQFTLVDDNDFARVFAVNQYTHPNILLLVKNNMTKVSSLPYYCNPF